MPVEKEPEIASPLVKYEVFATSQTFVVRICCQSIANPNPEPRTPNRT